MTTSARTMPILLGLAVLSSCAPAGDFLTQRWGNDPACRNKDTLTYSDRVIRVDLSALPKDTTIHRAVLDPGITRNDYNGTIQICPILQPAGERDEPKLGDPLALRGPEFMTFDATSAVRRWVKNPEQNHGLFVQWSPAMNAGTIALEVSFDGKASEPARSVRDLRAVHQAGQTFLTWTEIEDPVGEDEPTFENFHNRVLAARDKWRITYRVYRSDKPITAENIHKAEWVLEVPEILTCWNLKAVRNTEHPNQGAPTMKSELRPRYNNVRADIVKRYCITDDGKPLPRATGLAVIPAEAADQQQTKPVRRYYAVIPAINGEETVTGLPPGATLTEGVEETPAPFPATVFQRSVGKDGPKAIRVDVYNQWVGPPYNNTPTQQELYICNWENQPQGTAESPIPLWVLCGTYGSTAATMQNPGWYGARRHLTGTYTIGLAEGSIWQGFHECIGTLKGYDQGVVMNYPQRRVLAAAEWALWRKDLHIDPQRVYFWCQLGSWGLRYGDMFAVVMSNGYGNLAIGKQAQNHRWQFGTGESGSKNWLGVPQWEYANLAQWIRENPTEELPYWLCWPAYGAYPSHTVGDFGFLPWPETLHAMASTKRAFAAVWNSNGPGGIGELRSLVTSIRRDQSLPAFTNCSLDASCGDGDHADAQKSGGINLHQMWEPQTITDEADRWGITLYLGNNCPAKECTTDLTPRRCQAFKAKPGDTFDWEHRDAKTDKLLQSGSAKADEYGLVTVEGLRLSADKTRVTIQRK